MNIFQTYSAAGILRDVLGKSISLGDVKPRYRAQGGFQSQ